MQSASHANYHVQLQVLREDGLFSALKDYVARQLGPQYVESPAISLADIFPDTTPSKAIIFILSQGADPTTALSRFAESVGRGVGRGLHIVSLGQGQGPVAESIVHVAMKTGDWVCLQVGLLAAAGDLIFFLKKSMKCVQFAISMHTLAHTLTFLQC